MDDSIDDLLPRFLAGECTPDEWAFVAEWMEAAPSRRAYVESLGDIGAVVRGGDRDSDRLIESAWRETRARMAGTPAGGTHAGRSRSALTSTPARRWRTAAVAALGLGIAFVAGSLTHRPAPSRPGREFVTAAGQRLSVTLADGTRLTLAPASRVRVPVDYGRDARDVDLKGEAYFTVAHDAARPFAVHTREAVARDIGTAFDMRAYSEDSVARIVVTEGLVSAGPAAGADRERPLRIGDVATVDNRGVAVTHDADLAPYTSWTTGTLTFRDARFADLVPELNRWYDLDIQIPSPALRNRRVASRFEDAPVDQVLGSLATITGARYDRHGHTVMFVPAATPHTTH